MTFNVEGIMLSDDELMPVDYIDTGGQVLQFICRSSDALTIEVIDTVDVGMSGVTCW